MQNASKLVVIAALMGAVVSIVLVSLYLMPPDSGKAHNESLANFIRYDNPRPVADIAFMLAGEATTLSAFQAKHKAAIVVVNFWATWCAPCRREMPQLDALQAHFANKAARKSESESVVVLAVSLDRGTAAAPLAFLQELGVRHLTAAHDGSFKAARDVRIVGLPTTLIIDRQGREIGRLAGEADWASPAAFALLESLL
ncbi:MAG: TlpA family protein disulfide reductase [Alphaproteobacteria bacterium]|nr:TlpA family protein disulfide reductase [Alphaproteobacteria bacterium]